MFDDLDKSLQAILDDAAAPPTLKNAEVEFVTPDKGYAPTVPTINLFLHKVTENRVLRDQTRVTDLSAGVYTVGPSPLRVDCTYLVTAWSHQTSDAKAYEEHLLLGLALTWLSRFNEIESSFLKGALKSPLQPYPIPISVAQTAEGQGMGTFWTALGIPPRPGFSVLVTIALQPSSDTEEYPQLERVQLRPTSLGKPALVGRVLDHGLAPVPAATVGITGTPLTTVVGPTGEFRFEGLDFGPHTLRVQVTGRPDVDSTFLYDDRSQVHDVILPEP